MTTKITVWVLNTCIPGERRPCVPQVFSAEEDAKSAFAYAMHSEWSDNPVYDEALEPVPYPGDAVAAHRILSRNHAWGQYEITQHELELPS